MECIYCHEESEFRRSIMEELCTLPYSTVYVFRSQTYYGRCVVAFRLRHVNELFELTAEERHGYMDDVARTASVIQRAVGAEKINYAIYGDLTSTSTLFRSAPARRTGADRFAWTRR